MSVVERWKVVQVVRYAGGSERFTVYESIGERSALLSYESLQKEWPSGYFELIHTIVREDCLDHTGRRAATGDSNG